MTSNWFIGIEVPAGGWFEPLLAEAPPEVRRLYPGDLHLTVAFLGACGEERARAAWAVACGAPFPTFRVRLGRLAALGSRRRPSAFSIVLTDGHDEVAAFMAALQGPALEAAGCPPEKRAPLPHVTVARPRRQARDAERRLAAQWAAARPPVDAEVVLERLHLYTGAEPNAERRAYRAVATWPAQK